MVSPCGGPLAVGFLLALSGAGWTLQAVVVGDTMADVLLGRNARLGLTVGVTSGACTAEELASSDFVIPDCMHLPTLLGLSCPQRSSAGM
jgi:phosphoglycolate phosphatase-like HAD superfamily hydrolase